MSCSCGAIVLRTSDMSCSCGAIVLRTNDMSQEHDISLVLSTIAPQEHNKLLCMLVWFCMLIPNIFKTNMHRSG
jgi:hypothetical protein